MKATYIDTSCLVAIAFGEPDAKRIRLAIAKFDVRFASNLLEAELKAPLARENARRRAWRAAVGHRVGARRALGRVDASGL
jgi:uncharacterized protein with PIN domain